MPFSIQSCEIAFSFLIVGEISQVGVGKPKKLNYLAYGQEESTGKDRLI
ncbi:hypothetical protein [Dyadobacter sp. 3J3]|nr:hypothetical protein [Dyadobacter sp. 3J3]